MSVRIIVDSTVDMPDERKDQFLIVPLTVRFGDEEFIDGVTIDKKRFYERLVESDVLPTTSQATPDAFERVFADVAKNKDSAVVITISSKLSGTYQSACIAAQEYDNIFVVDSMTVAIGSGILAEYALQLAKSGRSAEKIAEALLHKREDVCLIALLDTLEYLKKGGRISKTTALAGGILGVKPILGVRDGMIAMLGKARGSRQGCKTLLQMIQENHIDRQLPVLFGYTGLSAAPLEMLLQNDTGTFSEQTVRQSTVQIGSVIGTHAGPGAIAVAFFRQ